jgi:hypothetical protein
MGIRLIVPESLKKGGGEARNVTEYRKFANVLDFKTFFEQEVRRRMPRWF